MKVSVITPSFNQGRFIGHTLDSVQAQSVPNLQHVIFDGGSSDDTVEILRKHGSHPIWVSEADRGQAHAVNKGIEAADGDIIGWLNSDDVYYPGAVARVVDFFSNNRDVDVVYGMADHIDVDDVAFEPYPTEPWDFGRLTRTCFICQPALFFRRRVVERFGLLDEKLQYCMDYEYWLRLGLGGARFEFLPIKLAGSRLYAENKTLGSTIGVHREINGMLRRTLGQVPNQWLYKYAHVVVRSRLDERAHPVWFARETTARTLLASLRWNGKVSGSLWADLFGRSARER